MEVVLELGFVELARAHPAEHPGDADRGHEVHQPDRHQEHPGHERADQTQGLSDGGIAVLDHTGDRAHTQDQQQGCGEDDRRVPQGEPEPRGDRRPPLTDELARGVVDRGDVVGVEGVPHAEHVRGQADAHAEDVGAAEPVGLRRHREARAPPSRPRAAAGRTRSSRRWSAGRGRRSSPGTASGAVTVSVEVAGTHRRYCKRIATSTRRPGAQAGATRPQRHGWTRGAEFTAPKQRRAASRNTSPAR